MPAELSPIRITGLRAVVFDLDDTLYPEQAYAFSGFAAVGEWLRSRVSCEFDPTERMKALFLAGERGHIFDRLLTEIRHADAKTLVPEMIECYRMHAPRIELHADARAAIPAWRGRFRLGLISDGTLAMQQAKVAALGLTRLLDEVILTGQWEPAYGKPHTRAFELMETRLRLHGQALVYIADNCGKDFIAPRQLGWRTVCVRRPAGIYRDVQPPPGGEPEHEVHSLVQLDLSA